MSLIRGIAQKDPSGILSFLTLLAAPIAALFHHPEFAPVFVALAAAVLGLRTQVTPVDKARGAAVDVAAAAASSVAENLSATAAGKVGEVTERGAQVVDDAVSLATHLIAGKL